MSETKPVRVLPADVYDTLELSALAYGGIGADRWYEDLVRGAPVCAVGHMWNAGAPMGALPLASAGIFENDNDRAVRRINRQRGAELNARVPFAEWARELNVVRGEATP